MERCFEAQDLHAHFFEHYKDHDELISQVNLPLWHRLSQ